MGIPKSDKPDILEVMREYFPSNAVKVRGGRGYCKSPFADERTASCVLYLAQNTFYCFSTNRGGDSYDLIAWATGKPLAEVLRDARGETLADIKKRRKKAQAVQDADRQRKVAIKRIGTIHRHTLEEKRRLESMDEDNGEMANVLLMERITWNLLERLTGSDDDAVGAINEAHERGVI